MGKSPEETRHSSLESSFNGGTQDALNPSSNGLQHVCSLISQGSSLETHSFRIDKGQVTNTLSSWLLQNVQNLRRKEVLFLFFDTV